MLTDDLGIIDILYELMPDIPTMMTPLLYILGGCIIVFSLKFFVDFVKVVFQYFFER